MRVQSITVSCFRSFGEQQNMLQVNPGVTTIVEGRRRSIFQRVSTSFTKPHHGSDHSVAAWTPQRKSCLLRRQDKCVKMVCRAHVCGRD